MTPFDLFLLATAALAAVCIEAFAWMRGRS